MMVKLNKKYVFHIPLYKYVADELVSIDIGDIIDELVDDFSGNGFDSLYMTKVKSLYKSRMYDEVLITIFTDSGRYPEEIFENWFRRNNHVMEQEAFAYECGNEMMIERLY